MSTEATGSKDDARKNAKEDQLLKDTEKKENERLAKEEQFEIRKEVGDLKITIASIAEKAKKADDVRKWFNLFDNDKKGSLNLDQLNSVLKHAGLRLPEKDLEIIFKLLDSN